jgi:GAF domain-containing protein
LYEIEVEWQHKAIKHPEEPLFQVIAQLQSSETLTQRLGQVVNITHEFINPSRTNLYGYSAQKRYFWQRLSNRQTARGYRSSPPRIQGQDVYDFYRLLASGQLVAVGTSRSPLQPETTKALLSHLKARSLLAAPIIVYDELVGFLSVEDQNARIWESAEQKFVSSVAQAIALVMAGEEVGTKLEQAKADVGFAADMTQTFARYDHPQHALGECAALLCQKLQVNRFWLLQAAEDSKGELLLASKSTSTMPYRSFYHYLTAKRRQQSEEEYPLRIKDWYEIRTTTLSAMGYTYAIDDLEADERLASSRSILLKMGIKSLLVCPVGNEDSGGVLLLTHHTPRTWTASDLRLANFIAPQLSWVLKLNVQRKEVSAIAQLQTTLQEGLTYLWKTHNTNTFAQQWLEYLAQLLDIPVALFLTWDDSTDAKAKVATIIGIPKFDHQQQISCQDPLIQATVATEGFYTPQESDLTASWLEPIPSAQVLTFALPIPDQTATGFILFADVKKRRWSDQRLKVVATLIQQFAQVYYYFPRSPGTLAETQPPEILHWYKHRALEILHQATANSLETLPISETTATQDTTQIQTESQVRQRQLLRSLNNTLSAMLTVVTEEKQQIIPHFSPIPLSNLLKECLYTVESHYKQKQLITKIYSLGSFNINSDRVKIACVLVELLDQAASNAPQQSQVELWYRPLGTKGDDDAASFLELSLLEPYQSLRDTPDNTKPIPPWQIPVSTVQTETTTLQLCQDMVVLLKGRLQFYQLKDRRSLYRLILPVAQDEF